MSEDVPGGRRHCALDRLLPRARCGRGPFPGSPSRRSKCWPAAGGQA